LGYQNLRFGKSGTKNNVIMTDIKFYNPNKYALNVKEAEMDVYFNDRFLGHTSMSDVVSLPPLDTTFVPFTIQASVADILANTGLSLQAIAVSGRPYTATITPLELGGAQTAGSINGSRKPWNYTLNLRVDKIVQVSKGLNLNIYCRVSNLLNQQNILNVYSSTGSPKDDGFLASSNGQDKLTNIVNSNRLVDAYLASYQWALLNPGLFSLPRRIFAGVIMDF
jgi:hypothetical protein